MEVWLFTPSSRMLSAISERPGSAASLAHVVSDKGVADGEGGHPKGWTPNADPDGSALNAFINGAMSSQACSGRWSADSGVSIWSEGKSFLIWATKGEGFKGVPSEFSRAKLRTRRSRGRVQAR